jgi:phenylalanyl-tRNA synthetase alpha subunit
VRLFTCCQEFRLIGRHARSSVVSIPGVFLQVRSPCPALTPEMIADGSWKLRSFKKANLDALGAPPEFGALHPLLKARSSCSLSFFSRLLVSV